VLAETVQGAKRGWTLRQRRAGFEGKVFVGVPYAPRPHTFQSVESIDEVRNSKREGLSREREFDVFFGGDPEVPA
jgi:hypothetical protein